MATTRIRKVPERDTLNVEMIVGRKAVELGTGVLDQTHAIRPHRSDLTHDQVIHPGLRFHDPEAKILVYEHIPMIKMLKYYFNYKQYSGGASFEFTEVPIPWQVYVIKYNHRGVVTAERVFWRNSQLKGMGSALGEALFTNRGLGGRICLPDSAGSANPTKSLSQIIDVAFNAVWSAGFNYNIRLPESIFNWINSKKREYEDQFPEMFKGVTNTPEVTRREIRAGGLAENPNLIYSIFPTHGHALNDVVRQYWPSVGWSGEYGDSSTRRGRALVDGHGDRCLDEYYLSLGTVVEFFRGLGGDGYSRRQSQTQPSMYSQLLRAITPS